MELGYVVEGTNKMSNLLHIDPDTEDLAWAAKVGCDTLKQLANDGNLFADLEKLQSLHWHHLAEFETILLDVRRFSEEFLPEERKALLKAGFNPDVVDNLLGESFGLRDKAATGFPSAEDLRIQIITLRQFVCPLAAALKEEVLAQAKREKRKQILQRVMWGIAGTGIIGVNAGGFFVTGGLSAPVATASGALGTTFVAKSAESLKEEGGRSMQARA